MPLCVCSLFLFLVCSGVCRSWFGFDIKLAYYGNFKTKHKCQPIVIGIGIVRFHMAVDDSFREHMSIDFRNSSYGNRYFHELSQSWLKDTDLWSNWWRTLPGDYFNMRVRMLITSAQFKFGRIRAKKRIKNNKSVSFLWFSLYLSISLSTSLSSHTYAAHTIENSTNQNQHTARRYAKKAVFKCNMKKKL